VNLDRGRSRAARDVVGNACRERGSEDQREEGTQDPWSLQPPDTKRSRPNGEAGAERKDARGCAPIVPLRW
jgi:hypothetical protein